MRHFFASVAITALTRGVLHAPAMGVLIAFAGCFYRGISGGCGAGSEAIDIAMIAIAADNHLAVTEDAAVQAGGVLHRLLLPMRTGLFLKMDTYYPHRAKARSWGAVSETVEVEPDAAPVSTALAIVPISHLMSRI